MDTNRILKIGLFGFGCVGQGLYDILQKQPNLPAQVVKICVKDPLKERSLPANHFTFDAQELLNDDNLDILVEAISDAHDAYDIVTTALRQGKRVVTANKKMVAHHLEKLLQLQAEYGGLLLYEAAVAGGIPIVRTVEEFFGQEPVSRISGILNGSSNYILSQIFKEQKPYAEALQEAQDKGFAELDPWLDVSGADSRHKLCILSAHAFGRVLSPEEVPFIGINALSQPDWEFARCRGAVIKLVASLHKTEEGKLVPLVLPTLVQPTDDLTTVEQEFNGIVVEGAYTGLQLFKGKGAGGLPTGAAVLSDIAGLLKGYQYQYPKLQQNQEAAELDKGFELEIYVRTENASLLGVLGLTKIIMLQRQSETISLVGNVTLGALVKYQEKLRETGSLVMATSVHYTGHEKKIASPELAEAI
ncbi:homoserine dehydrogenase [Nibribacter ruber]|uniref:Homoserine dehydrogenase n=1 Tax=Nibribacter ruber TaxID=2698458 RepID=A0A6P1P068_9BACT|nr:homoserine dehydrogenase [Nibribacter ruber]QHL86693.1 homoserine dehydrogenase [Nibribacter ruber]